MEEWKPFRRKGAEHSLVTLGVLCGHYEPNFPYLEGAADELLGRFRQRYESLEYVEGSDQKMTANNRQVLTRGVTISENPQPRFEGFPLRQLGPVLEATGVVFLIQDGESVWYWLFFVPRSDRQQYTTTYMAMAASITLDGKGIDFRESNESTSPPQPHSNVSGDLSAADTYKKSLPSVVLLDMRDSRGHPLKLGSGFFVGDNLIATNFHVIEGASSGYVRLAGQAWRLPIDGTVAVDKDGDLAVLHVSGSNTSPLQLETDQKAVTGDTVYVVGNPEGLEGIFSQGIISSVRQFGDTEMLQITAPISPGNSGGPVLNQHGEVVGVATAVWKEGQNLNFAVPAAQMSKLLLSVGPVVPLSGPPSSHPKHASKKPAR